MYVHDVSNLIISSKVTSLLSCHVASSDDSRLRAYFGLTSSTHVGFIDDTSLACPNVS